MPPARGIVALSVVVLAAGVGKRFRSGTVKVLHELNGRPLIHHVLDSLSTLDPQRLLVVVSPQCRLEEVLRPWPHAEIVEQAEPLGTADAVKRCRRALEGFAGTVLVLPGDTPLLVPSTLENLLAGHSSSNSSVSVLTALVADPHGYGRILRDDDGECVGIAEEADATPDQRLINEVSTGVWCFHSASLFAALEQVGNDNSQGEYYLPDAAFVIAAPEGHIYTVRAEHPREAQGVNDRLQLAEAARELRLRHLEKLSTSGVTIEDPLTTFIDEGVEVGEDTRIRPLTFLEGDTRIGAGCSIGPSVRIVDSVVEDSAEVTFAVIRESRVGAGSHVGPFAYIRPGAVVGKGAKVGTFVEIKKSRIGEGSKVPHLSYIGDAQIGKGVNIGAGTITGNYDTESGVKHETIIEDGAFTSSHTVLRAPVRVGKDAGTGAGSVVTRDVEAGEVVAGVPAKPLRKRRPKSREE